MCNDVVVGVVVVCNYVVVGMVIGCLVGVGLGLSNMV